jgi:aryl-alcohol dehydrogenase-like predicted oxidoreductase
VELRQLGANGPQITSLMFGAWPVGGGLGSVDESTAIATIQKALDLGITAIDTAEIYRASERVLGKALVGQRRDQVFITSKVSFFPFNRERVREALETSLRDLRTDYVDLYLIHQAPRYGTMEEAMAALAEVQLSGKARYVGVSNCNVEQMEEARRYYPIQANEVSYSILNQGAGQEILPYCLKHEIGVIVHSPLATGLLTAKWRPGHVFAQDDLRHGSPRLHGETFGQFLELAHELARLAHERGMTPIHQAIGWVLSNPAVTSCILGSKSPQQVSEQVGGAEIRLSEDHVSEIAQIAVRAPIVAPVGAGSQPELAARP